MVKLPSGFSPWQAIQQTVDTINPLDGGHRDRDVLSEYGKQSFIPGVSDYQIGSNQPTPTNEGAQVQGANTVNSGAYTSGGGGSATSTQDAQRAAEERAYLDEQEGLLRGLLSQAQTRLGQGLTQLGDDYNREQSSANQQRGRFMEDLNVKREDTTRDKMGAIGRVDNNARTLADSVRRQIGMASGSGSTAYKFAAPGAVSRVTSQDRSEVQDTYGKNFRDLATTERRGTEDFESLLSDLLNQRQQKERGLREGIGEQEIGITGQLGDIARNRAALGGGNYDAIRAAGAGYATDRTERQNRLNSLFEQFRTPYNVKPVNVNTPELSAYNTDRAAISQNARQQDPTNPYGNFLKRPEDEEKRLF